MDLTFDGDHVLGGTEARERFYDSRGYGSPRDGGVALAPVEAAHLCFRGDIASVDDSRPGGADTLDFEALLGSAAVSEVDFFVYKELRDRGFYLSPVRPDPEQTTDDDNLVEFVVYPRGKGPWDDEIAYRVAAVSERATVDAAMLRDLAREAQRGADDTHTATDNPTAVLAVVDEESEVTYLEVDEPTITGSTYHEFPAVTARLLSDRVLVPDPPESLHERAFYGQRLDRDDDPVQLSLVEAASLAGDDLLTLDGAVSGDGDQQIRDRGRAVEGDRFDRRLRVYSALRTAGVVPKTGFKFGADFRTYADVESVDNLGHSEFLVRVLPGDHTFVPRDLSLDVRLAHGVRKRMVFALTDEDDITWLSLERLTP
jgi:tRNA-intron endonuclease